MPDQADPQPPRPDPLDAARALVDARYPDCTTAFLAGSIIRGEATPTSDLDVVIVTTAPEAPYRESLIFQGWPVEAFVHSLDSLQQFFMQDAQRRRPSLPWMCAEGRVLRDRDNQAGQIKAEAEALLAEGPAPLTPAEVDDYRYQLTDLLDDLAGSDSAEKTLYIAPQLAAQAAEFALAYQGRWTGAGKWIPRALHRADPTLAAALTGALEAALCRGDKAPLVGVVDDILAEAGGRLFEGYRRGTAPDS